MSVRVVIREQEAALQLKGTRSADRRRLERASARMQFSRGFPWGQISGRFFVAEVHQEGYGNTPLVMPLIGSGLVARIFKPGVADQRRRDYCWSRLEFRSRRNSRETQNRRVGETWLDRPARDLSRTRCPPCLRVAFAPLSCEARATRSGFEITVERDVCRRKRTSPAAEGNHQ